MSENIKRNSYSATEKFRNFLKEIDGNRAKLALEASVSARTIARIRAGENVSSSTARNTHKAARKPLFGYGGTFESAFSQV
jgi:DNA transposition AAA+ family ATPase